MVEEEKKRLESLGINTVGRQGQHDYLSSSASMHSAKNKVNQKEAF